MDQQQQIVTDQQQLEFENKAYWQLISFFSYMINDMFHLHFYLYSLIISSLLSMNIDKRVWICLLLCFTVLILQVELFMIN